MISLSSTFIFLNPIQFTKFKFHTSQKAPLFCQHTMIFPFYDLQYYLLCHQNQFLIGYYISPYSLVSLHVLNLFFLYKTGDMCVYYKWILEGNDYKFFKARTVPFFFLTLLFFVAYRIVYLNLGKINYNYCFTEDFILCC